MLVWRATGTAKVTTAQAYIVRPTSISTSRTKCSCSVFGDYAFQCGLSGDVPMVGDWVGQGHDGVGLFRQSNGYTYLRNSLSTGYADITFVYAIAGDVPVAGHWQLTYPPQPKPGYNVVSPTPMGGNGKVGD